MNNSTATNARFIFIDPAAKIIHLVNATSSQQYNELKKRFGDVFFTTGPRLPNGDLMLVDDEGLLNNPQHFFRLPFYPQPIAGPVAIVGPDIGDQPGPCATTVSQVGSQIEYLDQAQFKEWAQTAGPAVTITSLDRATGEQTTEVLQTYAELAAAMSPNDTEQ
jgi:hypothetical protein